MSITPEDEIWKEVWRKYNQNPLGLKMYSGISSRGHPELLITSTKESWMIKRDSPYSGRPGLVRLLRPNDSNAKKDAFFSHWEVNNIRISDFPYTHPSSLSITSDDTVKAGFRRTLSQSPLR